ncbi:MAG: BrnT family toxin [Geminicoccaceae bacterium]|nr:MAG: BrnT family toxin [Geminicoccaceae bacterium]
MGKRPGHATFRPLGLSKDEVSAATGYLDGRPLVVAYTIRGRSVRIISMRKANAREQRRHAKRTADP